MNGLAGSGTSALIKRLVDGMEADFPGWLIARECSGRWVAKRSGWGALYGQSASELRIRLDRFNGSGDAR
ncbi:hypothetical protein [Actinomadura bangladeshensis]|uniref:Uncharacterized protein n=1 Tax=Actinomadura bangladeshensis TaxID=453573 RepID=A0A4R4N130_9ACTN|nr:hypothetical protein [Actinomadura bangladeshensis]TDC02371.1 hypothetical protein E1284_39485 [Actinomadura bangladeshensis]